MVEGAYKIINVAGRTTSYYCVECNESIWNFGNDDPVLGTEIADKTVRYWLHAHRINDCLYHKEVILPDIRYIRI